MAAKVPRMVGTVDVLLGNLEDAVKAENKEVSRQGLVDIGKATDFGPTQFWTRINSLDSPWVLDDLTTLVPEIGDKLDVIMVPKVQGAEDIHYVDRLLAQLEAKAGLDRPILVHAILETARGVANIEEICAASPRMQGLSLGPADLAADRRMKTTRVGGGHPGYLVRQDPVRDDLGVPQYDAQRTSYQQDLWHYTIARMVDACAMHGIYPYYGPFGDIKDTVACEDQFRNAFLLGCVGAWSLHPAQITIANKVFSPSVEDVAHARRVIAAMGDGTGAVMIDGKMEDDASVKQCQVMVALAEELAAIDPELKKQYDAISADGEVQHERLHPLRSVLYMPSSNERALEKAKTIACDGLILDLEDAVAPDAKPAAREAAAAAAASGDYGRRTVAVRVNGLGTQWHDDDIVAASQAGPAAIVVPKVDSADDGARGWSRDGEGRCARPHPLWAMVETPVAILDALAIARASERIGAFVLGTNDLVKELYAEHVPGRAPILPGPAHRPARRPGRGHPVIDGVYNDVKDTEGFLAECEQGRQMGFDGKTLDPPRPGRGRQRRLRPERAGGRGRPRPDRGLGGRQGRGRGDLQRPDGGEPPRRVRAAHAGRSTRRSRHSAPTEPAPVWVDRAWTGLHP